MHHSQTSREVIQELPSHKTITLDIGEVRKLHLPVGGI